jgi:hypothetical protein
MRVIIKFFFLLRFNIDSQKIESFGSLSMPHVMETTDKYVFLYGE